MRELSAGLFASPRKNTPNLTHPNDLCSSVLICVYLCSIVSPSPYQQIFMERFHSVTVRMAKRQNLSLNPSKISGVCGRLMCCLAHEVDQYPDSPRDRP